MNYDFSGCGPIETVLMSAKLAGEAGPIPSRVLMRRMGIHSMRRFRLMLERERRERVILANRFGLFIPDDGEKGEAELLRYIRTGSARIRGQARALRTAKAELRRRADAGQVTLDLGGESNG